MLQKIHKKYHKGELTLRDYLAAHRTILANDRTWLSYLRTALTLFVAGASFIRFFDSPILFYTGWTFIPLSILLVVIGLWRHHKRSQMIAALERGENVH